MRLAAGGAGGDGGLGAGAVVVLADRADLEVCGLPFEPHPAALARLRHVHAAGAVRLAFEGWANWRQAGAWRPERELRWRLGAGVGRAGHVPDFEILWPDGDQAYAGQVWCAEVELTAKTVDRTARIMSALLARTADYGDEDSGPTGGRPRYARVVYVVTPGARATVERARSTLAVPAAGRVEVRDLPAGAVS